MKNMVLYKNWVRGAASVIAGVLLISGPAVHAYDSSDQAQPSTMIQMPDISFPGLKNISIPTSISTLPKMIATGGTGSTFDFFQFFNLSGFGSGVQGGIYGFVVLVINIFITVLSVMGQIAKFILNLISK